MSKFKKKTIVFFHPDLGIGGAERLIIDAAVGLQNLGHKVTIYTSHCDPRHCFEEARDGTLDVRIRASYIPPSLLSRFTILLTILRQLFLILTITLSRELSALNPDVFILDQLSYCIPLLRWLWPTPRVLFYCHFPDQLLARGREKWWKRVWRVPFDWAEGWSMRGSEKVVVNSKFTGSMVRRVFGDLGVGDVGVVYPCVRMDASNGEDKDGAGREKMWKGKKVILSINRFEAKKDVGLAIRAFAGLSEEAKRGARLVIAGGYDPGNLENHTYHAQLVALAESLHLTSATFNTTISALSCPPDINITFLLSIPSSLKTSLLCSAHLLVYTPTNEHFGIVPVEAMQARVPVLAANTGGPLETIVDGETGWLRDVSDVEAWTDVMATALDSRSEKLLGEMGRKGRERTENEFSERRMAETLDDAVEGLVRQESRGSDTQFADAFLVVGVAGMVLVGAVHVATGVVAVRYGV